MIFKIERPAAMHMAGPLILAEERLGEDEAQVFHYIAYQLEEDTLCILWARSIGSAYTLDETEVEFYESQSLREFEHWLALYDQNPEKFRDEVLAHAFRRGSYSRFRAAPK